MLSGLSIRVCYLPGDYNITTTMRKLSTKMTGVENKAVLEIVSEKHEFTDTGRLEFLKLSRKNVFSY